MTRMMDIDSIAWLVFALPLVAFAFGCVGRTDSAPGTPPADVGDWRAVGEPESYDTETIFAYIDGHAEVYLAYGMRSCVSRRYAGPEGQPDIVVDVFTMATPDDAFGVFTVDLDGEDAAVGHDGRYRYGWLSFWKGSLFVSIYSEDETDATRDAVFAIGHRIAAGIDADAPRPAIVAGLPAKGLERKSVRFLRSEVILRTHLYLGESDVAGLGPDTAAALAKYGRDGLSAHLMIVQYPDEHRAMAAAELFSDRFLNGEPGSKPVQDSVGRWYAVRRGGQFVAMVLGAGSEVMALDLLDESTLGGSE